MYEDADGKQKFGDFLFASMEINQINSLLFKHDTPVHHCGNGEITGCAADRQQEVGDGSQAQSSIAPQEESDDGSEGQEGEDAGGNRPGVVVQKREVMEVCLLLHVVLIHHLWRRPVENHLAPAHFFHGQQKKAKSTSSSQKSQALSANLGGHFEQQKA